MQSFYLQFRDPELAFFWNQSSNYQSSLVSLYANLLYSSLFLESLSIVYNEVHLYQQSYSIAAQLVKVMITSVKGLI